MSKGTEMEECARVSPLGKEAITAAAKSQRRREGRRQRLRLKRSVISTLNPSPGSLPFTLVNMPAMSPLPTRP